MCLITKNPNGEISEQPIKCYKYYEKVLTPKSIESDSVVWCGHVVSPYMGELHMLDEEGAVISARGVCLTERNGEDAILGVGFLHAYKNLYGVLGDMIGRYTIGSPMILPLISSSFGLSYLWNIWEHMDVNRLYICEMEIPAGERYYVGTNEDLCTRTMIFKKEIKVSQEEFVEYCRSRGIKK